MRAAATRMLAALLALFLLGSAEAMAASGELSPKAGSSWQAEETFAIEWDPIAPPAATEAVYRIYDSHANLALAFRRPLGQMLDDVVVPEVPDVYSLEAWLENDAGEGGPHSTAFLRFDNSPPPSPELDPPSGWVLGTEAATVRVTPSSAPPPLSGFRGYAISADRGGGSSPCAQPDRCLASEIDLADGAGGTISTGVLPEGINFVRVAAVSGAGVPSPVATVVVPVDGSAPELSLAGAPAGWSNRPVQVTARSTDALSGLAAAGALGPFTAIAVDGGAPARAPGDTVGTWVGGSGIHTVDYFARDAAGNVGHAGPAQVRIDEVAPRVLFAAGQDPAEPERIEATVSDPLSGPSFDRGWIGVRAAGTRARYEQLPTRNEGDRLVARWDSDSYPPGKYEFLVTAYDAAGNSAAGTERARGGRMFLVNPLKAQVELEAGLVRRRFAGRLRRIGGGPLAGQDVVVTETFAAGSEPRQRTTVLGTDREGSFSLRLRPGPSRDVVARFAGTALLSRAAGRSAHLDAATRVRLRVSATTARVGGRPITFSGKVGYEGTAAGAVDGLPVELQFRYRGGAWSGFRTVEADARGRFRYRYRFSDDDSRGVRFQFRAHVKGREGWPYGPGTSRPVRVLGT
ncbi:MAG TPA: hypothetical protein VFY75_02475 [Solirubrobacterales bacterium]|nr:hypothetical protein [Solirubrobacterales bacterium]